MGWTIAPQLSRCSLTFTASFWSRRFVINVFERRAEALVAFEARLKDTSALEVVLDEFETRGLVMQRAPIAGRTPIVLRDGPLQLEFSTPGDGGPPAPELLARLQNAIAPLPDPIRGIEQPDVVTAIGRIETLSLTDPQNRAFWNWLDLADAALGGKRSVPHELRTWNDALSVTTCSCGAPAAEVEAYWTDDSWHAAQHEIVYALCLDGPHVEKRSET
ncbi:MAG: hypothetical protein QM817_15315 [Archangium sp.]